MKEDISIYFINHLSDKAENGYGNVYNDLFESKKYDNIKLLEIGIGTLTESCSNMIFWKNKNPDYLPGASLKAFRDYFPNGLIYGVDIQSDCMINENRIKTYLFNSTDKEICDSYFKDILFDFIIDDGDHFFETQIKTFENFYRKLNVGGYYILEDLAYPEEIKNYFDNLKLNHIFRDRLLIIPK